MSPYTCITSLRKRLYVNRLRVRATEMNSHRYICSCLREREDSFRSVGGTGDALLRLLFVNSESF